MRSLETKRWKEVARAFGLRRGASKVQLLPPVVVAAQDTALRDWFGLEPPSPSPQLEEWLAQFLPSQPRLLEVIEVAADSTEATLENDAPAEIIQATLELEVDETVPDAAPPLLEISSEETTTISIPPAPPPERAEGPHSEFDPLQSSRSFFCSLPFGGQLRRSSEPATAMAATFDFTPTSYFLRDLPWSGQTRTQPGLQEMMALATQDAIARSRRPISVDSGTVSLPSQTARQFLTQINWFKGALSA